LFRSWRYNDKMFSNCCRIRGDAPVVRASACADRQPAFPARNRGEFVDARAHFERAPPCSPKRMSLYPLHPGILFMEGDALLMMGESKRACEKYSAAYELDMRLNVPTFISARFSPTRAPAFSRATIRRVVRDAIDALMYAAAHPDAALRQDPHATWGCCPRAVACEFVERT